MAKKFVRGVTGVDDIESFDKTLTNVNDLISDGQNTYVHTKKGKVESYYNLTDNIKKISSSNTDLIEVNSNNNTATLNAKHDAQKEQVLESTGNTITIEHGSNETSKTTKVETNPNKILEHENLLKEYGISKNTSGKTTKLGLEYTRVDDGFNLNNLFNGKVRAGKLLNAPQENNWFFVSAYSEGTYTIQEATNLKQPNNVTYRRVRANNVWGYWREQVGDKSDIDALLAQKQNTITNNTSIGVSGTGLQQLYTKKQTYNASDCLLKTYVKSISSNTSVTTAEEEFNFILKIKKGATSATFTLNDNDKTKFTNIMTAYGENNSVSISECIFSLSGSSLTVKTANNVNNNYVITFSDII